MNSYKTIRGYSEIQLVEKRSVFIGYANKAENEQQAVEFINEIQKKHQDATHNVYAYTLRENNTVRFSDDGEPHGTAGVPVLEVIKKEGLIDTVVVVTRYFGGTLLGTGGLVRVYSASAKAVIDASGIVTMIPCQIVKIETNYNDYNKILYEINKTGTIIENTIFTDIIAIDAYTKEDEYENIKNKIYELTNGKTKIDITGYKYASF
ncbi:MAG: YigZ family protein [Clostridiales bacterium GWF2_38_85]|nr:MAG: YigZ family protein [Clostridiales bacterium GWF2_38_85]HBL83664.1 YigZ family protein [Clostridiales bacterium]